MAAGIILVKQVGGKVFDFIGGDGMLKTRDVIATNGRIGEELFGVDSEVLLRLTNEILIKCAYHILLNISSIIACRFNLSSVISLID
jgi:hypothetical protein